MLYCIVLYDEQDGRLCDASNLDPLAAVLHYSVGVTRVDIVTNDRCTDTRHTHRSCVLIPSKCPLFTAVNPLFWHIVDSSGLTIED